MLSRKGFLLMTNKKKIHIPTRLNVLFFAIFLLFSALIIELGVVQIVKGEQYQKKMEQTVNRIAKVDSPRGIFFDRYGNIIVSNEYVATVTFTNRNNSNEELIAVARKLNEFIDIDTSKVTERDMKDYWIITHRAEANELVTKEEISELENIDLYQLQLDRINETQLAELTEEDIEIIAIRREFISGYAHTPQRVKVGLSKEEEAKVIEHLSELPGIDVVRDSQRDYLYGSSLRSFFGSVGSISREEIDHYLTSGYDRNDLVGNSQLEKQYEEVLKGKKGSLEYVLDRSGNLVDTPIEIPGQRGNDLVLTIDMELQLALEEILESEVERVKSTKGYAGVPAGYAMLIEPSTGEVLAVSGFKDNKDDELRRHDLGIIHSAFAMGSTVKGATLLMGFETGVAHPGKIINDQPIQLPGRSPFSSHQTMGRIDDLTALERSSNIYMAEMALSLGGTYNRSQGRWFRSSEFASIQEAENYGFEVMRYYYSQFGLGVKTGVDLPNESVGVIDRVNQQIGNIMNFSIGQHDTYTTIQLAQYVSTIANGGYRIQPRLVNEILEPTNTEEPGRVLKQMNPTVLNRVDMNEEYIEQVQEGFRRVVHGSRGTATSLKSKPYMVAAKTGTAQVYATNDEGRYIRENGNLVEANNQTLIGYAPYDNPEVAFVVVFPEVKIDSRGTIGVGRPAINVAGNALDVYFDLKETRNGPQSKLDLVDSVEEEEIENEM